MIAAWPLPSLCISTIRVTTTDRGACCPGTHAHGVLTEAAIDQCVREIIPADGLVPRGGIIAMRPLLLHASSKAITDRPRRVLHIEYADSLDMPDGFQITLA